jgi:hypothetical protein
MSNARKARGVKAQDSGRSWAEKTYTKSLPVLGLDLIRAVLDPGLNLLGRPDKELR